MTVYAQQSSETASVSKSADAKYSMLLCLCAVYGAGVLCNFWQGVGSQACVICRDLLLSCLCDRLLVTVQSWPAWLPLDIL